MCTLVKILHIRISHREIEQVVNQLLKQCATAKEIAASSKPSAPIELVIDSVLTYILSCYIVVIVYNGKRSRKLLKYHCNHRLSV